jgi:hypothetical protein
MANSNVVYCEPNWTHGFIANSGNGEKFVELAPPLEDYCVVVDLEVEVPSRPVEGQVKTDSSTIFSFFRFSKYSSIVIPFFLSHPRKYNELHIYLIKYTTFLS